MVNVSVKLPGRRQGSLETFPLVCGRSNHCERPQMSAKSHFKYFVVAALAMIASSTAWGADGDPWSVSKSSGEVWLTTQGPQQVALGSDNMLKPGDTIRTGNNGRV